MSDPFEDPQWHDYAERVKRELVPKMRDSSIAVSMCTDSEPDPKLAIETGYMILLDKPIITVVTPGATVPRKLAMVSDVIVEADLDRPEETARKIREAVLSLDLGPEGD